MQTAAISFVLRKRFKFVAKQLILSSLQTLNLNVDLSKCLEDVQCVYTVEIEKKRDKQNVLWFSSIYVRLVSSNRKQNR